MNQFNDIYIIGAGGFGKEVRSMLPAIGMHFLGFADDEVNKPGVKLSIDELVRKGNDFLLNQVIGIGSSQVRKNIFSRLQTDAKYPSIIHPSVIIQKKDSVAYGRGSIFCAGSIFTCDITIGDFCLVNLNCTIGHDVKMGNFCSLMPSVNLSGNVTLENGAFLGTGAIVLPGLTIGQNAVVGAGAVVTRDVPPNTTVVGVPAGVH